MSGAAVAIISSSDDPHARSVARNLWERHRIEPQLLDLRTFPTALRLSARFGSDEALNVCGSSDLTLDTLNTIWWRRPGAFVIDAEIAEPSAREFAVRECAAAWEGVLRCVPARFVNGIDATRSAASKPYQLRLAREIGLRIPDTLVTNDPGEARAFIDRHDGDVIYKIFFSTRSAWAETRRVRAEDLTCLEAIAYAPVIFQEHIVGDRDLRATVIGSRILAAAFDLSKSQYPDDVRMDLSVPCESYELDAQTHELLLTLMRRLGLIYGAVDLRVARSGELVFFEVNPAGQFLYVEDLSGLPLSAAMADELAGAA